MSWELPLESNKVPVSKVGSSLARPLQLIALGLVIFGGIAGGMYVGSAWSLQARVLTPESARNDSFYDLGEVFPNHKLRDVRSRQDVHVRDLAAQGPLLLVYARQDCNYCRLMIEYWKRKVVSALRSDIQIVMVYAEEDFIPGDESHLELSNLIQCRTVTTEREIQEEEDGINATPTVVGIGTDSRIQFIISGFDREVSSAFINRHL